ncbi:hypothetical protein KGM_201315 [Danaus plexippus plexippus]|uniref:Uncharacterized protein n=1 Tax=Danaus plexippus plexippus TaxID=278856 RepID=A0A212F3Q8_DANPL|nr:hypothetical protein KGM_201315 [Danaus plexippus plexippus]
MCGIDKSTCTRTQQPYRTEKRTPTTYSQPTNNIYQVAAPRELNRRGPCTDNDRCKLTGGDGKTGKEGYVLYRKTSPKRSENLPVFEAGKAALAHSLTVHVHERRSRAPVAD